MDPGQAKAMRAVGKHVHGVGNMADRERQCDLALRRCVTSWSAALGDGGAGGVPEHAGVVPVAVQLEHGSDDILDAAVFADDAAEVAQVLLARADALVPGDYDRRVERGYGTAMSR